MKKNPVLLLPILLFTVMIYTNILSKKIKFYNTETDSFLDLPETYVILSSSVNPRYLFLLPITAAVWKKLGVQPIVILVDNTTETESLLKIQNTIQLLKEMNIVVQYYKSKKISPTSLSQIIRLFGSAIPAFKTLLKGESILIVSDADLAVFNLSNHIPDVRNGKALHLYNADCCKPISVPPMRGSYQVKQHTMITIGATVKTWKEIMGLNKIFQNGEEIEDYIIREFGKDFFHSTDEYFEEKDKISSFAWFADQSLISYKIDEWRKKKNNEATISKHITPPRRINRNNWPTANQFTKMRIQDYDDCHQPTAPTKKNEWEKYLPFLELVFKDDTKLLYRFIKYRESFC